MSRTNHICRIRIFSKSDDSFRLQNRDAGKLEYTTLDQFTIGSDSDCDVVLGGDGVEAKHLVVSIKGREIWVEDLGGPGGTMISGSKLSPTHLFPYKPGEVIQVGQADEVFVIEHFSRLFEPESEAMMIVNKANEAAEQLLAGAQRQIDERSRDAIEEALQRARSMAKDLLASAKSEASFHIKEAQAMAETIAHEGESRKTRAMEQSARFETDNLKLLEKKKQYEEATERSQAVFEEAIEKEQLMHRAIEALEQEQAELLTGIQELQKGLEILRGKLGEGEERLLEAQRQREVEQKTKNELEGQAKQLESHIMSLSERRSSLVAEIKACEEKQAEWLSKLNTLEHQFDVELAKLRLKVDEEYQLQIQKQERHLSEMREREALDQQNLQKRAEELEERRLGLQIVTIHERLNALIADRAALYGANKLRDNEDFKKDLAQITATALKEEFDFRRREMIAMLPKLARDRRRQKLAAFTTRYAGWVMCICLLAGFAYLQFGNRPLISGRDPAASAKAVVLEKAAQAIEGVSSTIGSEP